MATPEVVTLIDFLPQGFQPDMRVSHGRAWLNLVHTTPDPASHFTHTHTTSGTNRNGLTMEMLREAYREAYGNG